MLYPFAVLIFAGAEVLRLSITAWVSHQCWCAKLAVATYPIVIIFLLPPDVLRQLVSSPPHYVLIYLLSPYFYRPETSNPNN